MKGKQTIKQIKRFCKKMKMTRNSLEALTNNARRAAKAGLKLRELVDRLHTNLNKK